MEKSNRKGWSEGEDRVLAELIEVYGEKNWAVVSKELKQKFGFKKTAKQCRERWNNTLSPEISKDLWTAEEEKMLFELHKIHGNKWSVIASELQGRTDNSTKNHFYSIVRKNLRKFNKTQPADKKLTASLQTLLSDPSLSKILLKKPRHYTRRKNSSKKSSKKSSRCTSRSSITQLDTEFTEKTFKKPSRCTSRSSITQLDSEFIGKTLKPRPKIGMRRTSTNSEYALEPNSISRKGSVSNLEISTEENRVLEHFSGFGVGNSSFFEPVSGMHLPGLNMELRTPTERSIFTSRSSIRTNSIQSVDFVEFSRRESRNNTGESASSKLGSSSHSQKSWGSKGKSLVEVEKEMEKKRMFNFNIPDYSLSESFQYKMSPRAQL